MGRGDGHQTMRRRWARREVSGPIFFLSAMGTGTDHRHESARRSSWMKGDLSGDFFFAGRGARRLSRRHMANIRGQENCSRPLCTTPAGLGRSRPLRWRANPCFFFRDPAQSGSILPAAGHAWKLGQSGIGNRCGFGRLKPLGYSVACSTRLKLSAPEASGLFFFLVVPHPQACGVALERRLKGSRDHHRGYWVVGVTDAGGDRGIPRMVAEKWGLQNSGAWTIRPRWVLQLHDGMHRSPWILKAGPLGPRASSRLATV